MKYFPRGKKCYFLEKFCVCKINDPYIEIFGTEYIAFDWVWESFKTSTKNYCFTYFSNLRLEWVPFLFWEFMKTQRFVKFLFLSLLQKMERSIKDAIRGYGEVRNSISCSFHWKSIVMSWYLFLAPLGGQNNVYF